MKRITVELTDELDARLRQEAARRQTTVSQLTREAIETALGGAGRRRFGAAKAGGSGQTDISERIEQILSCQVAR